MVEVARMAAHIDHAVDRGRAADHLAARRRQHAAAEMRLRLAGKAPVVEAHVERDRQRRRHLDQRPDIGAAKLDDDDRMLAVFRQPVGHGRAGRAGADDDEIRFKHGSYRHRPYAMKSASETLPPVATTRTVLPATSTLPPSSAASDAAPDGSSTSFIRSKAIFMARAHRIVVDGDAANAGGLDRRERRVARPSRHQPVADRFRTDRHGLDAAMRQRRAHAVEAFRLDADDLGCRRQIVEGERNAADQPAAADRAEQQVGAGVLGVKLVERFEPGAGLAGDDLRVVEGMQQARPSVSAISRALAAATSSRARSPWSVSTTRAP